MTKTYGIYGYKTANLTIPVGNGGACIVREFLRGNPQPGPYYRPATYSTSDKVEQMMIEQSKMFGHQIVLIRQFGEDGEAQVSASEETKQQPANDCIVYADVTTIEELRVVLKGMGAKAATLASEDAMRNFIERKKLSFPNFSF